MSEQVESLMTASMLYTSTRGHRTRLFSCGEYRVNVSFIYDPACPFEVMMRVFVSPEVELWRFARTLLTNGLNAQSGMGDVQLTPSPDGCISLTLASDDGRCVLHLPAGSLWQFVADSYALVPSGTEVIDVDTTIGYLLTGDRP